MKNEATASGSKRMNLLSTMISNAAFADVRKQPELNWDIYTKLKLDRLQGWLNQQPLPVVLQGMNIDRKLLDAIDFINEQLVSNPAQYEIELTKPHGRLQVSSYLIEK